MLIESCIFGVLLLVAYCLITEYTEESNKKCWERDIKEFYVPKTKIKDKIEEKCKAFRHRTHIEEILEYEFRKLEKELLEEVKQ